MIHILIVDESPRPTRELASFLQQQPDTHIIGCATTREEALYQVAYCDLVLINLAGKRTAWLPLVREIATAVPQVVIMVMTAQEDAAIIVRYVEMGARGYVLHTDSRETLMEKVRAANEHKAIVSPQVGGKLISRLAELEGLSRQVTPGNMPLERFDDLSSREWDVLRLVGDGRRNQEIGSQLHIKEGTVKNHVHHILQKLDVNSRREAAAAYRLWLIRHRWHTG